MRNGLRDIAYDTEQKLLVKQALAKASDRGNANRDSSRTRSVVLKKHREIAAIMEMPLATVLSKHHSVAPEENQRKL